MDRRLVLLAFFIINIGVLECTVCKESSCTHNVTCPVNKPYTQCVSSDRTNTANCRYVCVGKCNPDQVLDGSKCINVTECHKAIVFQGDCLDQCPVGYVFSYGVTIYTYDTTHDLADLKSGPCITKESLRLQVAGFAVAMVAYILFLVGFFSLKSFSFKSMKKYFRSLRKRKQKKNADTDSDESDEEMISTAGNHIVDYNDENMLL